MKNAKGTSKHTSLLQDRDDQVPARNRRGQDDSGDGASISDKTLPIRPNWFMLYNSDTHLGHDKRLWGYTEETNPTKALLQRGRTM